MRTSSKFRDAEAPDTNEDYHLWDTDELDFAGYAHVNWHSHVQHTLTSDDSESSIRLRDILRPWSFWYQNMITVVRLSSPWSAIRLETLEKMLAPEDGRHSWFIVDEDYGVAGESPKGQILAIASDKEDRLVIADARGEPLPWLPPVSQEQKGTSEKLSSMLRSLSTFHVLRSITAYKRYSPIPSDWFSVRMFNKANPTYHTATSDPIPILYLTHGDVLSYVLSNRTPSFPAHVHMLSLNASWTVGTLLWNVRLPAGQDRAGDFTMVVPHPVNKDEDDPEMEAEDRIIVIFCVGERSGCTERLMTPSEWLKGLYIPPVLVEPGEECLEKKRKELPVWPFFVPPPSWVVKEVVVRTKRRSRCVQR